jgi:ABC-type oligopeptide transport system substrate-binding subunit
MHNKKSSLLLGVLLSTMITISFIALSQISEKASAQGKTTNVTNSSAMMMINKTAATSDVLMNKVRSMGNLTANATYSGVHNMTK